MSSTGHHSECDTSAISLEGLSADPFSVYAKLRKAQPAAWAPRLGMWLITRYEDVRNGLLNTEHLTVRSDESLLFDTFGEHMLTTDGDLHRRYRDVRTQGAFMPASIRKAFQNKIDARVTSLIDGFVAAGKTDLRPAIASRLPVLMMLDVFGLPDDDEPLFRSWYNSFEAALSNHARLETVKQAAAKNVSAAHQYFQERLEQTRSQPNDSFFSDLLSRPENERLSDEQIRRNALIIFFGGISTVEALILNTMWALFEHPAILDRIYQNPDHIDLALDETIRWQSPVQSATRHATADIEIAGTRIPAGATVNLMLASANRDETVFDQPDLFDIDRPNLNRHLGFATGPHLCLGRHLAKAEARTAILSMLARLRNLRPDGATRPEGHEFRQPLTLPVRWGAGASP